MNDAPMRLFAESPAPSGDLLVLYMALDGFINALDHDPGFPALPGSLGARIRAVAMRDVVTAELTRRGIPTEEDQVKGITP